MSLNWIQVLPLTEMPEVCLFGITAAPNERAAILLLHSGKCSYLNEWPFWLEETGSSFAYQPWVKSVVSEGTWPSSVQIWHCDSFPVNWIRRWETTTSHLLTLTRGRRGLWPPKVTTHQGQAHPTKRWDLHRAPGLGMTTGPPIQGRDPPSYEGSCVKKNL